MAEKVESGKEVIDNFFKEIENIENVDKDIAIMLRNLYEQGKLTDTNVKNELQALRQKDVN